MCRNTFETNKLQMEIMINVTNQLLNDHFKVFP